MLFADLIHVERGGEFGVIGSSLESHMVTIDGDDGEAPGPRAVECVADFDAGTGGEWIRHALDLVGGTHGPAAYESSQAFVIWKRDHRRFGHRRGGTG